MNLLVVVLAFLAVPIHAWLINTMTDEIVPGTTTKMWLECRRDSATYGQHSMTIINIAISKYTAAGSKTILAQIDESNNIHTLSREASFKVTGDVLNDTSKFLRLTWSEVDVDDAGWYGCEVKGLGVLGNAVNIELKPKDVRLKTVTMADVKQLIKAIKNEYDVTHNRLKSEMESKYNLHQSEMEKKINRLDSEIEDNTHIQSEMEKKHNHLLSEKQKKHNRLQSEMEKKINRLELEIDKHTRIQSEIDKHTRIQSEMEEKHNSLQSEIDKHTRIQSEMEKKHNRLQSEIEKHTRIQSEMEKKHNRLQSEMEKKFNSEMANITNLMNGGQCQPPTEPPTSPATTLPTTTPPVVTTTLPTTTPPVVTTTLPSTTPQTDDDRWPLGKYDMEGPEFPCPASHSSDVSYKGCYDYYRFRHVILSTNQTLCYCRLYVKKSSRATWPRGSYCLDAYSHCPTSFTRKRFAYPLSSSFYTSYCCRSDGSTSNEINLPNKTPFYLFTDRSNICQQVKGMNVTQTYVAFDTKVGGYYKEAKRIVQKSPRLCHYQPV